MSSIRISIIICTQDRPDLLAQLLETLARQTPESRRFEVLIVDNGSGDETSALMEEARGTFPELRYHREHQTGLSHARNSGWEKARGEYVAFIDDDCKLPPEWLAVAQRTIEQHQPVILGGPYYPFYDSYKPPWFRDSYRTYQPELEIGEAPDFSGCNIVFRGDLIEKFGGFDPGLGMSGQRIAWGEETDLQRRIWAAMPDGKYHYEQELCVFHLVRREKMTFRWLVQAWLAKGRDRFLASPPERSAQRHLLRLCTRCTGLVARIFWDTTIGTLLRDRENFKYPQNYWYEHTSRYFRSLGYTWAELTRDVGASP